MPPGGLQLLDHKPPACTRLHRERPVVAWQLRQPPAQPLGGRRGDLTPLGLPGHPVDPVEGDLPPVHIKPSYDAHRDLLRAPPMWLQHDHPCLSRRRSLHIASLGWPSAGAAFGGNLSLTWLPRTVSGGWRPRSWRSTAPAHVVWALANASMLRALVTRQPATSQSSAHRLLDERFYLRLFGGGQVLE